MSSTAVTYTCVSCPWGQKVLATLISLAHKVYGSLRIYRGAGAMQPQLHSLHLEGIAIGRMTIPAVPAAGVATKPTKVALLLPALQSTRTCKACRAAGQQRLHQAAPVYRMHTCKPPRTCTSEQHRQRMPVACRSQSTGPACGRPGRRLHRGWSLARPDRRPCQRHCRPSGLHMRCSLPKACGRTSILSNYTAGATCDGCRGAPCADACMRMVLPTHAGLDCCKEHR